MRRVNSAWRNEATMKKSQVTTVRSWHVCMSKRGFECTKSVHKNSTKKKVCEIIVGTRTIDYNMQHLHCHKISTNRLVTHSGPDIVHISSKDAAVSTFVIFDHNNINNIFDHHPISRFWSTFLEFQWWSTSLSWLAISDANNGAWSEQYAWSQIKEYKVWVLSKNLCLRVWTYDLPTNLNDTQRAVMDSNDAKVRTEK